MAKKNNSVENVENTQNVANAQVESTAKVDVVENIEDTIKNENKMDDKALDMAKEQIQKEKDERKANILRNAICKADYINKRELLELRKRRKEENATKAALTKSKELLDNLTSGKITPTEYEKQLGENDREKRKAFSEIDDKHRELVRELRDNYPAYYCYDWEFERRCSSNW